jgi:cytochrome c nitrite reductase small subunit
MTSRSAGFRTRKRWFFVAAAVVVLGGGGAFAAFGPPGLYAKTAEPSFCGSCHVLEMEYKNWFMNGGHRHAKCVDCHLPNDHPLHHFVWKGYEGVVDVVTFYAGRGLDGIKLSPRGARQVVDNCRRCHAETMARVNEDRNCWDCHRRLSHLTTGTM